MSLLLKYGTLICTRILVFPIGINKISTHVIVVFDFISVPYTISALQPQENL